MKKNKTMFCINDGLYRAITSVSYKYILISGIMNVQVIETYKMFGKQNIDIYDIVLERKKGLNIISSSLLTYSEIKVLDMLFDMFLNTIDFNDSKFFNIPKEFYNMYARELNSLENTKLTIFLSHNRGDRKVYVSQMLVKTKGYSVSLGEFGKKLLKDRRRISNISSKYIDKNITRYSKYQLMKYISSMIFINREKVKIKEISMIKLLENTIIWNEKGYNTRTTMLSLIQNKNANATNNYRNFVNALKNILKECEKDSYVENIEVLCNGGLKGIENDKIIVNFNKKCR